MTRILRFIKRQNKLLKKYIRYLLSISGKFGKELKLPIKHHWIIYSAMTFKSAAKHSARHLNCIVHLHLHDLRPVIALVGMNPLENLSIDLHQPLQLRTCLRFNIINCRPLNTWARSHQLIVTIYQIIS